MIDDETVDECIKREIASYEGDVGKVFISKESIPRNKETTLSFDLQSILGIKSPYVRIIQPS